MVLGVPDYCYELARGDVVSWFDVREFPQIKCLGKNFRGILKRKSSAHGCFLWWRWGCPLWGVYSTLTGIIGKQGHSENTIQIQKAANRPPLQFMEKKGSAGQAALMAPDINNQPVPLLIKILSRQLLG